MWPTGGMRRGMNDAIDGSIFGLPCGEAKMTPPTVLVVDSDPIMLTAQAALFHQMGAEAICARDMSTARRVFDERTPNLVVCEYNSDSPAAQICSVWHSTGNLSTGDGT